MDIKKEQKRFNELSPDAAGLILAEMEGQEMAACSCWYCNGSHEHLQQVKYPFICVWGCGVTYLNGFPAVIVFKRSKNELIDDACMAEFAEVLSEAD